MSKYVFDSGPFIDLFRHYYPERFPSLWQRFYGMVDEGRLLSVSEVHREIGKSNDSLADWVKEHKKEIFLPPSNEELLFVRDIFKIEHFQMLIRKKERLQGNAVADPFVIARAKVFGCYVVTTERYRENGAGIPNVCKYFSIPYTNLEGFMQQEGWVF